MAENNATATATSKATEKAPIPEQAQVRGVSALSDEQFKNVINAMSSQGEENFKRVFAYNMKENIALYGAVKTAQLQTTWVISYLCDKLKADAKQLETRLENKRILAAAKANQ